MKKALLSIVLCCISIVCVAQTDVTKFLGIPVDGSKKEMIQKLKSRGFVQNPYYDEVLNGKFNGIDVNVFIATNNDKVYRIMLCDVNTMDETDIKIRFNILCKQFENNSKYCSFSERDQKLEDDEDISYEMSVHKKRYQATFYQLPDTTVTNYKNEVQSLIRVLYTEEEQKNLSEEETKGVEMLAASYVYDKIVKKSVWFMIAQNSDRYYIVMYYDNVYNEANGEDL